MRSEQKVGRWAPLAALALALAACGEASPTSGGDPVAEQPVGPSPNNQSAVAGIGDHRQRVDGRWAWRTCRSVQLGGDLVSARLTTVGQLRGRGGGSELGVDGRRQPLWPSVAANAPAALCSVKTGVIFAVAVVGPHHRVAAYVTAKAPFNPAPGDPPPG